MLQYRTLCSLLLTIALVPSALAVKNPDAETPPPAGVNGHEDAPANGGGGDGNIIPTKGIDMRYLPGIPKGEEAPPADGPQRTIHPVGRPDLCLRVQGGEFILGAEVGISYCIDEVPKDKVWQHWTGDIEKEGRLAISDGTTEFCLGGGQPRSDGTRPRLVECGEKDKSRMQVNGVSFKPGKKYQVIMNQKNEEGVDYCLDVRYDDSPEYKGKAWQSLRDVQLWTCGWRDEAEGHQAWAMMRKDRTLAGDIPTGDNVAPMRRSRMNVPRP